MASIIGNMPESPKPKGILPPNSPERPDWGILSDCLRLKAHQTPSADATPEQAAVEMRALMLRCVGTQDSYDALIMKCAGRQVGEACMQATGKRADAIMPFLRSRLWNRRKDGQKTISRLGREFTSNDVLLAWNPISGGIAKYVQVNVSHILMRDLPQYFGEVERGNHISLDQLKETNVELDHTGRIVHQSMGVGGDEQPDYVEQDSQYDQDSAEFNAGRKLARDYDLSDIEEEDGRISPDDMEEEVVGKNPAAAQFEANVLASRGTRERSYLLRSANNPDYALFQSALMGSEIEPELDADDRQTQLRELAGDVISLHLQDSPDLPEALEAVGDWHPAEVAFANFFPEVVEEISNSLNQVHAQRNEVQLDMGYTADAVQSSGELERLWTPKKPQWMGNGEWKNITRQTKDWHTARMEEPAELLNPRRPDYLALCLLCDEEPATITDPEQLGQKIKTMAGAWLKTSIRESKTVGYSTASLSWKNSGAIAEMSRRMEAWDPMADGFLGEVMTQHFSEIRHEELSRELLENDMAIQHALKMEENAVAQQKPRRVPIKKIQEPEQGSLFELT